MLTIDEHTELKLFLDEYDKCWYDKDLNRLKKFYSNNNRELIYFDNHKGNDTFSLTKHLDLIKSFFENGKTTESGDVEEIVKENVNYFVSKYSACICFYARYKSFPTPAVRTTMYLEKDEFSWIIKHVHCSFEPLS